MKFRREKESHGMPGESGHSSRRDERRRVLVFLAVAVLACLSFIPAASASVIGTFNESSCGGGGVTVTLTQIIWSPPTLSGTAGCIITGIGTDVTYAAGGPLLAGVTGNILDLTLGGPPVVDQFITFPGLDFELTGLGPGSPNTNCAGLPLFGTCSVIAGSPFVLTNLGATTEIALSATGTIFDTDGTQSNWFGAFTTQLIGSPAAVQNTFATTGSIESAQSGQFEVDVIPEPASMTMIGAGLIAIAMARMRRKARV